MPDTTKPDRPRPEGSLRKRVGWFVGLYLAGLAAVGITAAVLRFFMELTVL